MKNLNIKALRIDGGTQSRAEINNEAVAEYVEAMKAGATFPPVIAFYDGADYWLADGFHRYHAYNQAGRASIEVDVCTGTVRDAIIYSLGVNNDHGLRRTNADKRKAVQTALNDAEWAAWSDRKIAEVCGVTHPFVASIRAPKVVTVTTQKARNKPQKPGAGATPTGNDKPEPPLNTTPKPEVEPNDEDDARVILSEENDRLSARLAVAAMDATPEEKALAAETIESLTAQIKTLTAELDAVKASRDNYMRESSELKKQCAGYKRQLDKLKKG